jgi:sulfatase modifying factor 1
MKRIFALAALLFAFPAYAIDWLTVGDPGNLQDGTGYGAVADTYRVGKFEITNTEYAEFLNAVARTADPTEVYDPNMGTAGSGLFGGITRSPDPAPYTYSTIATREGWPVNHVTFFDALRFANWLHNGQPTGAQDSTTTEGGAYTLLGGTPEPSNGLTVTRNAGAEVFLPSEDEWYKAAYYDPNAMIYFDYPAGSDTEIACAHPVGTANTANCRTVPTSTPEAPRGVGGYTGSPSPIGTFDQGGNMNEWVEETIGIDRVQRGGSYAVISTSLSVSGRRARHPTIQHSSVGFRVARLGPAPAVPSVGPLAIAVLFSLLGLAGYRMLRV